MSHLAMLLLIIGINSLQIVPPGGQILGKYYMTNPASITTSRDSTTTTITMDKETIIDALTVLQSLKIVEDRLIADLESESRVHKTQATEFISTSLGNALTLLGADTAAQSAINCTVMGGHFYDIKNSEDVEVIRKLSTGIKSELEGKPGVTIPTFNDFWQEIHLTQEKLPRFLRTGNTLPLTIGSKKVTANLGGLTGITKCAFFSLSEGSYSTADCNNAEVKKHVACELKPLEGKKFTFYLARHLRKTLSFLSISIPAFFENIKKSDHDEGSTTGVLVSIFDKNETRVIRNVKLLNAKAVSYNDFSSITDYSKILVDNLQSLYNALRTKDINQILPILKTKSSDTSANNLLSTFLTRQVISTEVFTTSTKVVINVGSASKTKLMMATSLHPLIFYNQQPQFSGQILKTKTECIHNDCISDPCNINTVTQIPCCNVNILGLEGYCPDIASTNVEYMARLNVNKYLLVSSVNTPVTSHTCPNINIKLSGTILLTIDIQKTGCDIQVGNTSLPIIGSATAEVYTSPTRRTPINIIQRYDPSFTEFQGTYNKYLLPVTVILGTLATLVGTTISLYLFLKKRLSRRPNSEDDMNSPAETQHPETYPLRSILKPIVLTSNMLSYNEDSETSSTRS